MLWHFIINFGHSLRANKVLTLINVLSLSLGLAVFAIASLYVQRELSYDHGWPNAERIHRLVVQSQGVPGSPDGFTTSVNPSSYQAFLSYFSEQIEAATRLASEPMQVQVGEEDKGDINFLTFVDPAFADIFTLEILEGSLTQVLANPGLIALTEARAEILGESGRVGQRLLMKALNGGGEQEFEVGAIVRLPELTTQPIQPTDMLAVFSEYAAVLFGEPSSAPWEVSTFIRLLLKPGVGTQEINEQMQDFVESTFAGDNDSFETGSISDRLFYELEPIREIYLDGLDLEAFGGNKAKVITFAVVGLLVLLVGCSNSASLSFANALRRRREVGIRKVFGADKQTIMLHYLGESVLLALASCWLALALLELLLAPVRALLNISGELSPSIVDSGILLGIAGVMGLINGAYPAFVLSELRPQSVMGSAERTGSKGVFRARAFLVGGQLTLTVMFLASAFVLYAQLMFIQAQPLGYDHRNLLYFSYNTPSLAINPWVVTNTLLDLPGVVAAAPNVTAPPNMNLPLNINAVNLVSKHEVETQLQVTRWMMFEGFPEMLGVPLLAGRPLEAIRDSWTSGWDLSTTVEHALINRRTAQALGFASPESAVDELVYMRGSDASGQPLDAPLLIVGVLEDSHYSSIHRLPMPEFFALMPESYSSIKQFMIRYDPAVANDIQQSIATQVEPYGIEPSFIFIENRIEAAYFQDRSESRLLLIAAGMALLLSCVGMYGLVATIMVRSVKEVGVRKVLGASTASLLGLFLWRFSRPALLANLIAWPLAGWFVLGWIQRFPYQIDLAWLPPLFFCASLLVLLVAWLTIIAVTARAAQWKPSKSLRYE